MNSSSLSAWLKSHDLEQFLKIFEENEVDLVTLRVLTESDLKELGLPFGPRKRILNLLNEEKALEKSATSGAHIGAVVAGCSVRCVSVCTMKPAKRGFSSVRHSSSTAPFIRSGRRSSALCRWGATRPRTFGLEFQPNWAVSRSPLCRKVLESKCILEDRMAPRELNAFVGASASARRNKEKSAGSRHRHKGGHHHARQSPERKSV
jgi:hypothetical protein